ncbi:MAG: UDP-N-acetylglucosamine 1-carboxyvinyltransferase [Anaerolineae bacterium]|nr:UDP-N-acetylglucosamine 1-carboxyvinyltransferase [Anaerolineae bacterium]
MRIGITGNRPLRGTYTPGGNSNAALGLIAASLLTDQPVTLHDVPETASVGLMLEVAGLLGAQVSREQASVRLQTPALTTRLLNRDMTSAKVGVVLFLPALLLRRQQIHMEIGYPASRLHTHLTALRDLGCRVTISGGSIELRYDPWAQREIILMQTSVTATMMVALLAAGQPGETTIHNAASEPHVCDVLHMLARMGATIEGIGSNVLRIKGAETLGGAEAAVAPDHIEAASVAALAALTGGRLAIEGVRAADLRLIAKVYARLGLRVELDDGHLFVPRHESLLISSRDEEVDVSIETAPWPGFPSDLVAIATLIATQASGTILVHEKLFKDRLMFVDKLKNFGAQIVLCDPHRAIVVGPTALHADYLDTPDVRTGLGLLGAALVAEGETLIDGAEMFEWNFGDVLARLQNIGAEIRVLSR